MLPCSTSEDGLFIQEHENITKTVAFSLMMLSIDLFRCAAHQQELTAKFTVHNFLLTNEEFCESAHDLCNHFKS